MKGRSLHLAAYDVRNPRRLRRALDVLKDFACGGQKSVFECWLDDFEKTELLERVKAVLQEEDRFLLVPLATHHPVRVLGIAVEPRDDEWYYVG
ncbi:MAG: CRISPR-associated endoribonuclease Cas2 1 [Porticoccaceae bacterium]|nr:MAG: CRISPR-associated endoribonuclease Cas2 1 [Porticoccaceae bacterium]